MIINEGERKIMDIVIKGDAIEGLYLPGDAPRGDYDNVVDATGCMVFPGLIDSHVHFREPGMTHKADMATESRAAAYGGVTTYFDMPNTVPQTTSLEAWHDKFAIASSKSCVNYSFFYGATNGNAETFKTLDVHSLPGIKLFMGSSTGNMLVDREESLLKVFSMVAELGLPVMAHCEDTAIINTNMQYAKVSCGDDPDVIHHAEIRSVEACLLSSQKAVELARSTNARLHIAHITTAEELSLVDGDYITAEVTPSHLLFSSNDYSTLGTRIKCNPSIKSPRHRDALRRAVADGILTTIGTDHAPHTLQEKEGGAARAVSGMPMIQFSLVTLLSLMDEGVISPERIAEMACHAPARLFSVSQRGYLRKGYKADIAIVRKGSPWTVTPDIIQSKCGWSPLEGRRFEWSVVHTFVNGRHILNDGIFDATVRGEAIRFRE